MRKRAKLTQEQLKAVLQGWKTLLLACRAWDIGEHFSDEHVYTQIEELIERGEEDSDLAAWMDRCHELELEVVKLKQRSVVTREMLQKYSYRIVCDIFKREYTKNNSQTQRALKDLLAELGITVETIH